MSHSGPYVKNAFVLQRVTAYQKIKIKFGGAERFQCDRTMCLSFSCTVTPRQQTSLPVIHLLQYLQEAQARVQMSLFRQSLEPEGEPWCAACGGGRLLVGSGAELGNPACVSTLRSLSMFRTKNACL